MKRRLFLEVSQMAFVPAAVFGEPFDSRWWVVIDGERRFRLLRGPFSGCWYASVAGRFIRLGSKLAAEEWVIDCLIAEKLRAGAALH